MDRWAYLESNWANVTNTPFRKRKNTSWHGGTATPLIAWWPGQIPAGQVSHEPAHFIDIMPTLMDITGAQHQETWNGQPTWPLEGVSLLPVFRGEELTRYYPLYFEFRRSEAVVHYPWKILRENGSSSPWKLFDLRTDRTETTDVSADHPEIVERMDRWFDEWRERCQSSEPVPPPKLGAVIKM
jgi:arylsulfatase